MDLATRRVRAVEAARDVGAKAGFGEATAIVLQDTNNVVVWLSPHPVVAKVGTWPHSLEVLTREVEVCRHLSDRGAPIAPPLTAVHCASTGEPVSIWTRLEAASAAKGGVAALAAALETVHEELLTCPISLPSYLDGVDRARATLADDIHMRALPAPDLAVLRASFDRWDAAVRAQATKQRPLHGEPHSANVIVTTDGPMLIDFEASCMGPLEWDLASLDPAAVDYFDSVDHDLLRLTRLLNSARVATWCWAGAHHPSMRRHGEYHLNILHEAYRPRG